MTTIMTTKGTATSTVIRKGTSMDMDISTGTNMGISTKDTNTVKNKRLPFEKNWILVKDLKCFW